LPTFISAGSVAQAAGRQYLVYDVAIQGTVSGRSFQRAGQVYVLPGTITTTTTNGVNPLEVWLRSGSPATSPQTGAIWFATNNAFLGSRAQLDLAYVSAPSGQLRIDVKPDWRVSATGGNVFNALSGLTADMYQIFDGAMQVTFSSDARQVTGTVSILGTGAIFHSNTPYTATFSGTYKGTACCV
jgi:hypothetical protein